MAGKGLYTPIDDVGEEIARPRWTASGKTTACLLTAVFLLPLLALTSWFLRAPTPRMIASEYTGISTSTERWIQYHWWSDYSGNQNRSQVDAAWSAVTPAHGIVALDNKWAAEKKLPATMKLPSDHTKGIYIIDAYHQLHCLTIIRQTFFEMAEGNPITYPPGHSTHCFDALRQYVTCTAGDTPLYTWGKNETGDGQLRKCRDWKALSDWAADNSACYKDTEQPVRLGDHFGHCNEKGDGLEVDR